MKQLTLLHEGNEAGLGWFTAQEYLAREGDINSGRLGQEGEFLIATM